jgi:hypothetical protein
MIKIIQVVTLSMVLIMLASSMAFGSPETIQADNGLILPPTGLEFSFSGKVIETSGSTALSPEIKASVSYGAFPSVTVTGEIAKSLNGDISRKLVKLYFSPVHDQKGYTIYLNYDLDKAAIPVYGVSLWFNSNLMLTFINIQNQTGVQAGATPITVTPGVSFRLGKLGIGGETVFNPSNWSIQTWRAGVTYAVFPKVYAKLSLNTGTPGNPDQLCQLGLNIAI